jgi:hypothetical protein
MHSRQKIVDEVFKRYCSKFLKTDFHHDRPMTLCGIIMVPDRRRRKDRTILFLTVGCVCVRARACVRIIA